MEVLVVAKGDISIQGKPVKLISSTKPKEFPKEAGWFTMIKPDGKLGVAKVTESKLEVKMIVGDEVVPATVQKEEEDLPEIPKEGKLQ